MEFIVEQPKLRDPDKKVFYRYNNEYNSGFTLNVVKCLVFDEVRETPKGHYIDSYTKYGNQRWVSKTSRKRFAYPTKKEALTSFLARKKRQVSILEHQLTNAKSGLAQGLRLKEDK